MVRLRVLVLLAMLFAPAALMPAAADPAGPDPLVVFLVRHAEKADAGEDPDLTPAGAQRAAALAAWLRDAGIAHVHSSDFTRTRKTAAPTAAMIGVEVTLYDPRDLEALADRLRGMRGRHLVVGHSNTTPALVGLLGGDPGPPIDEKSEYDRLYVVTRGTDGSVSTVLMRYGPAAGDGR